MGKWKALGLIAMVCVAGCSTGSASPMTLPQRSGVAVMSGVFGQRERQIETHRTDGGLRTLYYDSDWGSFSNPWGWPYYVPPIYTTNLGNPFAPPPLAAGPWINPIFGTVSYTVGWPGGFWGFPVGS